ncbi:fibronectin type III domain-containing protein [Herbidospora yilanensis]|uniref:fibronectin type III domain-containing protein n=1 Tax=Herbidospora yilanensis TaxID=354426 RepID=UPI000B198374|nr:fibronectin type III domain-containing protein [Herbidospora yilanensis]
MRRLTRTVLSFALILAPLVVTGGTPAAADPGCREGDTRPICTGDPEEPGSHDPVGGLSAVIRQLNGIQVVGTAYDPSDPTAVVTVDISVDGTDVGSVTANQNRSQKFDGLVPPRAGGQVCATVRNIGAGAHKKVGCVTKTIKVDPFGAWESVTREGDKLRVKGWVIDPDSTAPVQIDVYDTTKFLGSITADTPRTDVGDDNSGYGNHHGFDALVPADPADGEHRVCLVFINKGPGAHVDSGCKPYSVRHLPWGSLDESIRTGVDLRVVGWVVDDDAKTSPVTVDVVADGKVVHTAVANQYREEVGRDLPEYGYHHGFDFVVPKGGVFDTGRRTVCVRARNLAAGTVADRELGCRDYMIAAPVTSEPQWVKQDVTTSTATFWWKPVGNAEGYRYAVREATSEQWVEAGSEMAAESPSKQFTGLKQATVYCFRVTAYNHRPSQTETTWCSKTKDVNLPGATDMRIVAQTDTSITWQWTDNTDREELYKLYRIRVGGHGEVPEHTEIPASPGRGGTMTHTFSGLRPGIKYLFRVTPYHPDHVESGTYAEATAGNIEPEIESFTTNYRVIDICDPRDVEVTWKVTGATKLEIKQNGVVLKTLTQQNTDLWEGTLAVGTNDGHVAYTLVAHGLTGSPDTETRQITRNAPFKAASKVIVTNTGDRMLVARLFDRFSNPVKDLGTIAPGQVWSHDPARCEIGDIRIFRVYPVPSPSPSPSPTEPPTPPRVELAWTTGFIIGHDNAEAIGGQAN